MSMKGLIKQLLREELMHDVLYGYHVTHKENLDSIRRDGFKVGERQMQGQGFYSFYDYDHAVRYAMKNPSDDVVIIKFTVRSPKSFLCLNMDIAKQLFGPAYHLKDQVENYYKREGGFQYFYEICKSANPNLTLELLLQKLDKIETDNSENNQRTFWAHLLPKSKNDKLDIILDGYYGVEIRVNSTWLLKAVGYDVINGRDEPEHTRFNVFDDIPKTSEFQPLIDYINDNNLEELNVQQINYKIDSILEKVRSNREYEYYNGLSDLIMKLK